MRFYEETQKQYENPSYDREAVRQLLCQELAAAPYKIVVLDDDPTGVQTVHDVSVYTDWSYTNILAGFMEEERTFYILTNSRAMTKEETTKLHQTIARAVARASRETGTPFLLISRGDSTLRGHYPLETQVLFDTLLSAGAECPDGEILIPYFQAGGRYTVENIHYVRYGDALIPAGETEFAKDRTFGYQASDLRDYIEEKTEGRYGADRVAVISLESLRQMDYDGITGQLMELDGFDKMIVNALEPSDLEAFCVSLYRALQQGKRFLFRTAADFVKAVSGISDRAPLRGEELVDAHNPHGGIVVVGSHTAKTTEQMNRLHGMPNLEFVEFDSDLVLKDRLDEEVARVVEISEQAIRNGK
ncbi:MAG: four-carbon acid sugar kinase family protein, partial [Hungatella sp.]